MIYAVSTEGVAGLRDLAFRLVKAHEQIKQVSQRIQSVTQDNEKALGPHAADLAETVSYLNDTIKSENEAVIELSREVLNLATAYEEIFGMDVYDDIGDDDSGHRPPVKVLRKGR